MCRHLAYVGAPLRCGALLTDPPHSLVRQSWAPRRQQHGVVNADGFGVGWYVDGVAEPARYRGGRRSGRDESFADLARVVAHRWRCWPPSGRPPSGMAGGQAAAAPFRPARGCSATTAPSTAGRRSPARLGWGLDPGALATAGGADRLRAALGVARDLLGRGKPPEAALTEVVARVGEAGGGRLTLLLTDGHAHRRDRLGHQPVLAPTCPAASSSPPSPTTTTPAGSRSRTAPC